MNPTLFCATLLTFGILQACAPQDSERGITLETGLKVHSDLPRIDSLMNFSIVAGAATCVQKEIVAVYQVGGEDGKISSFPIRLRSELFQSGLMGNQLSDVGVTATAIDWLNHHSELMAPIQLPYVKDITAVGLFGAFYEPHDVNGDGFCDDLDATPNPINSFSLYGHTDIAPDVKGEVPVKIWALGTEPSRWGATYSPPTVVSGTVTNQGGFYCDDLSDERSCSFHDITKILRGSAIIIKQIDHLILTDHQTAIRHKISPGPSQASYISTVSEVRLHYEYLNTNYTLELPELSSGRHCVPYDTACMTSASTNGGVPTAGSESYSVEKF